MSDKRKPKLLKTLANFFSRRPTLAPELQRAVELLKAIDAGGIPLNPAIVSRIARDLGLEVGAGAAVEETLERIRAAVERGLQNLAMQDAANRHKGGKK